MFIRILPHSSPTKNSPMFLHCKEFSHHCPLQGILPSLSTTRNSPIFVHYKEFSHISPLQGILPHFSTTRNNSPTFVHYKEFSHISPLQRYLPHSSTKMNSPTFFTTRKRCQAKWIVENHLDCVTTWLVSLINNFRTGSPLNVDQGQGYITSW